MVVNYNSNAYIAGVVTEVTVEIAVTAGGATLRHVAKHTTQATVRKLARPGVASFRKVNNNTWVAD